MQFVNNFTVAVNPQITKSYASGEMEYMHKLVCRGARFSYFLLFLFVVPIVCEADYILRLWLKIVPENAPLFLRLALFGSLMMSLGNSLLTGIFATGNIKRLSIMSGSIIWMTLIPIHICFKLGASPASAYIIMVLSYALVMGSNYLIIRNQVGLKGMGHIIMRIILSNLTCVAIVSCLLFLQQQLLHPSFARLTLACIVSTLSYATTFYALFLTNQERKQVKRLVTNKLHYLIK